MALNIKQTAFSLALFALIMGALVYADDHVRERVKEYTVGANGVSTWGRVFDEAFHATVKAVQHQSIENAPMMLFVVVGVVLFIFMVKS